MKHESKWTDHDGDTLRIEWYGDGEPVVSADPSGVILTRGDCLDLYHRLGEYLMATNNTAAAVTTPDAVPTCCTGEDSSTCCPGPVRGFTAPGVFVDEAESVAMEAHQLVYGDRQGDYGHPREDFTRTAILWTGLLQHKLVDGAYIEADDIGRCMIAVKLSRDVNSPKRDNRVDMAGYAITLDRLETGR